MSLTIVTVVLNDPAGLEATLESVDRAPLSQQDVKLLIMDGGSAQETLDVAEKFLSGPEDRLMSSPDLGPYDAMNRALDVVDDSDLVWFVNAGDYLLDSASLVSVLQWTSGSDFVWGYGPVEVVEVDGSTRRTPRQLPYSTTNHAVGKTPICHQTVVAKASALKEAGGFDLRFPLAADFKLLCRLGRLAPPRTWPRAIVAYKAGGLSDRHVFRARREQLTIRREEVLLDRRAKREAILSDQLRLGRLVVGRGLDWCATRGLVRHDWRRQAALISGILHTRGLVP